jgi:4-hydroxybenzoate polyprenyltransferase
MVRQGLDHESAVADRQLTWVDRLPQWLRPFAVLARWDRPIGTWLLLWPCWWAVALAPGWPDLRLLALFAIGAIAMRGAGCVINDLADRDLDAKVARTRHRPLASGRLSAGQAVAFLILQLLVGLIVLLNFNRFSVVLGLASMPLVIAYPFMKRITWWPQAFLGLTFNWGALVGWSAVTGELAAPAVTLYVAGILWTLGYDTIYAHQDKIDDALIGVKSSARWLGEATIPWLWRFYAAALLLIGLAGWLVAMGPGFYLVLVLAGGHLVWQVRTLDLDDPMSCLARFRSNRAFGLLVFLALLAGKGLP